MKEFTLFLDDIFKGLNPDEFIIKESPSLEFCHNLEPFEDDYEVHETVISLNSSEQDWDNSQDLVDYWIDQSDDDWQDNQEDVFTDI